MWWWAASHRCRRTCLPWLRSTTSPYLGDCLNAACTCDARSRPWLQCELEWRGAASRGHGQVWRCVAAASHVCAPRQWDGVASVSLNALPETPALKVRKPPAALFRYVVNPIMRRMLRTRFGARRIGQQLMLLRFTGRRTGRQFEIPAGYHRAEADLLVFTHSAWWRNLRNGVPVQVLLEGTWQAATADATDDPAAVVPFFTDLVRRDGPAAAARYGLPLPKDRTPSQSEMRAGIKALGLALIRIRERGRADAL